MGQRDWPAADPMVDSMKEAICFIIVAAAVVWVFHAEYARKHPDFTATVNCGGSYSTFGRNATDNGQDCK